WAAAATRSTRTTRSTSQPRSSPLSLIFRCVSPLYGIHSASVSGRPSPTGCLTSPPSSGSSAPTRWYSGMRGCGSAGEGGGERLAPELLAKVVAEVVGQEVGPVGVPAVEAVGLAEGVVQRRVERAGDDERAQRRDRLGQPQAPRQLAGRPVVLRLQRVGQ